MPRLPCFSKCRAGQTTFGLVDFGMAVDTQKWLGPLGGSKEPSCGDLRRPAEYCGFLRLVAAANHLQCIAMKVEAHGQINVE